MSNYEGEKEGENRGENTKKINAPMGFESTSIRLRVERSAKEVSQPETPVYSSSIS
jgi:hypothetical protein